MASNVAGAIGTQRQFTSQPQDIYAKRLAQVNGHVGVEAPTDTDGIRLAQSLGVLSTSISEDLDAKEKNLEKIGIAGAERVAAGLTEEDWKTRDAITLLGQHGQFQTADNPYAVALIEKMRGKYFSAQFDNNYKVWKKEQQEQPKTYQEEATRYQKYMHDNFAEVANVSSNQDAFNQGYFDNFMVQTNGHVQSFLKEKSANLDAHRIAGTSAELGNVTLNYHSMTTEQKNEAVNNIINKAYVSQASDGEVIEQVSKFISEYAERTGDVDFLSQAWGNIKVGLDPKTGEPRSLGNVVDMSHSVKVAEAAKRIKWDKTMYDTTEKLSKMSIPDIYKNLEDMEKTNNHLYQSIKPLTDNIIKQKQAEEAKAKVTQYNSMVKGAAQSTAQNLIKRHMQLYLDDKPTDLNSMPTATSISDFKGKATYTDANGKEHSIEITPQMVNAEVKNQLDYIASSSKSEGEVAARSLKLLKWGVAKDYRESFAQTLSNELGTLTVDKLDPNGELTGNLKSAMVMYHSSRESFKDIFGNDATKQLGILNLLQGGTGSMKTAAMLYAQARDNRQIPENVKRVEADVNLALPSTTMDGIQSLDGGSDTINMEHETMLGSNWDMYDRTREVVETLMYTGGYTKEQAITAAKKYTQDNYVTYRGTAIPKGVFDDLDVSDKMANGRIILDTCIDMYKTANPTLDDEHIIADYNEERGVFMVSGGGRTPMTFSKQELVQYGNKRFSQWQQENPKDGEAFTLDEINAERKANNTIPEEMLIMGD